MTKNDKTQNKQAVDGQLQQKDKQTWASIKRKFTKRPKLGALLTPLPP